jgi:hypothetical protein
MGRIKSRSYVGVGMGAVPLVRKSGLMCLVVVWKSTLLSSRRAGYRSRHVQSHPGLDQVHADRCPLSPVFPFLILLTAALG